MKHNVMTKRLALQIRKGLLLFWGGNQWNRSHILEPWPLKAMIGSMHCPRSVCSRLVLPIKMSKLSVTDLGFRSPKLDKRNNYEQGGKSCLSQRWACCHLLLNQRKSGTADTFSGSWPWKYKSPRFSNLTPQCNGLLCFRFVSICSPLCFFQRKRDEF